MKASELRTKSEAELQEELIKLRKAQFGLRMQQAAGQLAQNNQVTAVKRDIARIKTVMNEMKAGAAS